MGERHRYVKAPLGASMRFLHFERQATEAPVQ
jgi:hypothetical protein